MTADPKALYQEVILDHNKKPRNYGELAEATHRSEGVNPLCGDHIHLALQVADDKVERIMFQFDRDALLADEDLVAHRAQFRKRGGERHQLHAEGLQRGIAPAHSSSSASCSW